MNATLQSDRHFLPEWLEKYPVFGMEMKLAWRRMSRNRIVGLLVVRKSDSFGVRILKEVVITSVVFGFVFLIAGVLFFPEIFVGSTGSGGYRYNPWVEMSYPLVALFFVCLPAIQGSDCFHTKDNHSFFKLIASAGIRGSRQASELLLSGLLKYGPISVLAVLVMIMSLRLIREYDFATTEEQFMVVPLFLALLILQSHIFVTSSVFGATRLHIVNRRFAVLGFWFLSVAIPILLGFWLSWVYGEYFSSHGYYYAFESNMFGVMAAIFPLGSVLTYALWSFGETMFGYEQSLSDLCYAIATVLLHVVYSYFAYRLLQKLFNRRLSE